MLGSNVKFRARVEDNERWVYTTGIYFDNRLDAWLVLNGETWEIADVVHRFTGMFDLHGAEIYEGDVLKRAFSIGTTHYDFESLGFVGYEGEVEGYFVGEVWYRPSEGFIMKNVTKVDTLEGIVSVVSYKNIYSTRSEVVGNVIDGVFDYVSQDIEATRCV